MTASGQRSAATLFRGRTTGVASPGAAMARRAHARKIVLRAIALGYLTLLLLGPVVMIFYRTFEHGLGAVLKSLTTPGAVHALLLSLAVAAIAVPLNTVFGIGMALLLERGKPRAR